MLKRALRPYWRVWATPYTGFAQEHVIVTVNSLLGEDARDKFELYFQWYNVVHELGHSITINYGTYVSNNMNLHHMADEEQLVNSFAVAFWMNYGGEEKLNELEAMLESALSNITPPVANMSHPDFMRKVVDEDRFTEVFILETSVNGEIRH